MKKKVIIRILLMFVVVFIAMTIAFFSYSFYMENVFADQFTLSEYISVGIKAYIEFIRTTLIEGNWGYTIRGESVSEIMLPKFMFSLKFIGLAVLFFIPIGISVGVFLAYHKGSLIDKIFTNIALIIGHIPVYLFFTYALLLFGYVLHILPKSWPFVDLGFATPFQGTIIPVITLVSYPASIVAINLRAELIETFDAEYFTLARAKGLTKMQSIVRHSLRPSMVSLMPIITNLMVFVIGMSFLIEVLYYIPGIGAAFFDNLIQFDPDFGTTFLFVNLPAVIIITTFYMLIGVILVNLSDAASYLIDPRIK